MYVHLSWAPRWRLLCQLEDGINPFEALDMPVFEEPSAIEEITDGDDELLSVVQNITYNIQDSAISGDLNVNLNINESE